MSTSTRQLPAAIVGGGMSGTLMAIYLAQRGLPVDVYEHRGDGADGTALSGRSFNITLSTRGLRVLDEVGLLDAVMRVAMPLTGRMVHTPDGNCTFQPYGKNDHDVIYSLTRNDLYQILLRHARGLPEVHYRFHTRCLRVDKQTGALALQDAHSGEEFVVNADFIIGSDGAFSTVRQQMQRGERASYQQDFLNWGHKELTIPARPDGAFRLEQHMLHVWSRNGCLLLAFPNYQGFFSCMCLLPFEGDTSFATLQTRDEVAAFFAEQFPDVLELAPTVVDDFMRNPAASLVTTSTSPWYYKDRMVLVGDACHAVVPFYGQGLNAALEDCAVLSQCINKHGGACEAAFAEYQGLRKVNTDTLAELSKQNFIELRDRAQSPLFNARKRLDTWLYQLFPRTWQPLYTMIAHTYIPYADALARARQQDRIARLLGLDVLLALLVLVELVWGFCRRASTAADTLSKGSALVLAGLFAWCSRALLWQERSPRQGAPPKAAARVVGSPES